MAAWLERYQVALYLAALGGGAAFAVLSPDAAAATAPWITPVLGLLLFVTFLQVPFAKLRAAFRDGRFVATLLIVNFVAVPLLAFALTRLLPATDGILLGALLVLLAPCIDYVVVFAGIAGGARERLIAATPLLMLAQLVLLPAYLWLLAGEEALAAFDPLPLVEAFALLIVLPLGAAVIVQLLARRHRSVARAAPAASVAMVPLMMATLAVVVASQWPGVSARLADLAVVVPVFVAFAAVMVVVGAAIGRIARLPRADRRATIFSGVTRNSLVVLPIALALPASAALAPLVVVTQTLVELLALVVLVAVFRRVPR